MTTTPPLPPKPEPTLLRTILPDDYRYGHVFGYTAAQLEAYVLADRAARAAEAAQPVTRRPSLWALQAREALELIAAPMRPDGTWNRDREACRQLAAEALGRYDDDVQASEERGYERVR